MSIGVFMTAENSSHEQKSMDLGDGFWVFTFGKEFFCPQRAIESSHVCVFLDARKSVSLRNQITCNSLFMEFVTLGYLHLTRESLFSLEGDSIPRAACYLGREVH